MNSALASSSLGSGGGGILGAQAAFLGTADLQVQPPLFFKYSMTKNVRQKYILMLRPQDSKADTKTPRPRELIESCEAFLAT